MVRTARIGPDREFNRRHRLLQGQFGQVKNLTKEAHGLSPGFLKLVDEFIHLANRLAEGFKDGEVSAAILFAAGRCSAFNYVSHDGTEQDKEAAVGFYASDCRKALVSNMEGAVGPVVQPQG